ncbi:MAG: hypothetical protein H6779_00710 [Candidatus Nomurabacteria bacterium]|nr:hypothetical protein [Candidatus Nomurabacteria bacterium]USN87951.1 MAG: hypothetical protein H6779_00710 [Candidatus Nomurabacteria bacterium]
MENHTAKHFVLQLGSLITLYLSIAFLLVLHFNIINLIYPDAVDSYWQIESYRDAVRWGIAMLIVFFPTYIILTRRVNKNRRQETSSSYLGFTKWLIYLSLLIGGGVLLGDLVAVILAFLNGEITTRFVLKAGALLLIVGAAFYYYLQDARGYWLTREKVSIYYGVGMSAIVLATLLTGFSYIETPTEVRELKIDEKQLTDLQDMQFRIEDYLRANNELPQSIESAYVGVEVPVASEGRKDYSYELTDEGFKLCAEFAEATQNGLSAEFRYAAPLYPDGVTMIKNPNNWDHEAGYYCFLRVIGELSETVDPTIIKPVR